MRIWALHPSLLDRKRLGAQWNEGQRLQDLIYDDSKTGWRNHPLLKKYLDWPDKGRLKIFLYYYLREIALEAESRGYSYNSELIRWDVILDALPSDVLTRFTEDSHAYVTADQLRYEFFHMYNKVNIKRLFIAIFLIWYCQKNCIPVAILEPPMNPSSLFKELNKCHLNFG